MSMQREQALAKLAADSRLSVMVMADGWGFLGDAQRDELNADRDEQVFQVERVSQGIDKSDSPFFIDPELTKELWEMQLDKWNREPWYPAPLKLLRPIDHNRVQTFSIERASGSACSDNQPISRQCYRNENGVWLVNIAPAHILALSIELGHDVIIQPKSGWVKGIPHLLIVDDYI